MDARSHTVSLRGLGAAVYYWILSIKCTDWSLPPDEGDGGGGEASDHLGSGVLALVPCSLPPNLVPLSAGPGSAAPTSLVPSCPCGYQSPVPPVLPPPTRHLYLLEGCAWLG